jgi:hypothetical protein
MDAYAIMLPAKFVVVPNIAELPTAQKQLAAFAPLISITVDAEAVMSVLPIWKVHVLAELPWPSRVRPPVKKAEELNVYTPGVRVIPPRSFPVKAVAPGSAIASIHANVASNRANATCAGVLVVPPMTMPGRKPVIAVPGETPRLPVRTVLPVLWTLELPKTAKDAAD